MDVRTTLLASILLLAALSPESALAQYKNTSFGADAGYWLVTKPSIVDADTGEILQPIERPLRLANGFRLGGEVNFKLDADHWWLSNRFNVGFMQYHESQNATEFERQYDRQAKEALGTIMGLQIGIGVRYFFLTDRVRPYVQGGASYMHLLSFRDMSSNCQIPLDAICPGATSNAAAFLPRRNLIIGHLRPGLEVIVARDTAIHLFADLQQWFVINAADNQAIVLGAGLNLYGG